MMVKKIWFIFNLILQILRNTELQRLLSGEMFHFAISSFPKSSSFGCKLPLFRINSV